MNVLWVRTRSPFAAFRYFNAGVYRASSPIIPHSAAWGLVLNLAGIEIRKDINAPITIIDPDAPPLEIAVGTVNHSDKSSLYQQLHSYPVGSSGKDFAERTKGTKYWIAPVRREVLVNFDAMIGIRTSNKEILERVSKGLKGELKESRYGFPFAGDNNFLFDRIDCLYESEPAYWYTPLQEDSKPRRGSCRLTVKIDRKDSSKTHIDLFAPTLERTMVPPENAWIWTPCCPK